MTHLEKDRAYHRALYDQRKKEGLCTSCGDPAIGWKILCERCRVRKCARVLGGSAPKERGRPRSIDTSGADDLPKKTRPPRIVSKHSASFYPTDEQLAWLRKQPGGVSATIRRLIEAAMQEDREET